MKLRGKLLHKSNARKKTIQTLYSYVVNDEAELNKHFALVATVDNENKDKGDRVDEEFAQRLIFLFNSNKEQIDSLLETNLESYHTDELDLITLSILRTATTEMLFVLETPYKSVIAEALQNSYAFGFDKSYKIINRVLDNLAYQFRKEEYEK